MDNQTPDSSQPASNKKTNVLRIAALILSIAITAGILIFREPLSHIGIAGYPGIFIMSLLANATIVFPVPGVVVTTTMATIYPPVGVAIASGLGAACGELTGYFAGFSGQAIIENRARYDQLIVWVKKYGGLAIFVLAFIPNPAFDLAGIVAGALKMPFYQYFIWCSLGKILKMLFFAYAGAAFLP